MIEMKLFVVKTSKMGVRAIRNIKTLLDDVCRDQYTLTVIDVFEDPMAAETDRILATPTLVRTSPKPQKRLMGDLSDMETVKMMLEL